MKICPTCQQTYTDESLNFCLSDGAVLVKQDDNAEPPKTVFMNQPPTTSPNTQFSNPTSQPTNQYSNQSAPPNNWGISTPVSAPPKPKSRTWLWVLGIFGALVILCGGGFAGFVAYVSKLDENNKKVLTNNNNNVVVRNTNSTTVNNDSKTKNTLTDDLANWKMADDTLGYTDYLNNEFQMTAKPGQYFILMSANKNFRTDNATTRVTARNVTGARTTSGYGLMVHNNVAIALAQDYAFLIDSDTQSYRVVKHQARKETIITKWTNDSSIKSGTQSNTLEVRDDNGKMTFYINGKSITTVEDKDGIKSGVAGLYVSGAIPIAFSSLQVEK